MREKTMNIIYKLRWFPAAFIVVFIVVFFGYLPPSFDATLFTDNIVGEGVCETSFSTRSGFEYYYKGSFYFGSELKEAKLRGYHYSTKYLKFNISGVSEAEIEGFDLYIFGIKIGHYNQVGRILEGEYDGVSVRYTEDGQRVHFDFEDPDAGKTIALVSHIAPVWFWVVYFSIIAILSSFLALLIDVVCKRISGVDTFLLSATGIMVSLLAGCFFCGSFPYVDYTDFLLNWLFLYCFALMINSVTLPYLGTVFTMAFSMVWYIINYFVINLRSKPVMPADLKAIRTATEVMGGYTFRPGWKVIIGAFAVICYAVAIIESWKKSKKQRAISIKRNILGRTVSAALAILLFIVGINTHEFKSLDTFAWDMALLKSFHEEGMVLTYLKSALNSAVKTPDGYSRETVNGFLEDYSQNEVEGIRPTNIIMVMNEAFSDLRTVGLDDRIDVMPFIDSLNENTIEGRLYVSIFGGGTCNTEFEGLTGNTLAFLGQGAYPYTENVTEPLFSLASYFRDMGYITEAFHANEPQNWNRNMVYPNLGFSQFHSIMDYYEALDDVPYLHNQPADKADYAYIEQVDSEYTDRPRFLFNVTMQNHSGYERWEDVERAESVMEYGGELYEDTKIYLSLVQASDEAVKQLVETYRDSDEPTMVIFFGDHQPGLPIEAQNEIYNDVESFLDWYKTRFFIWTNYESESAHDVAVSANFLPYLILEKGNFPLPPYVQMLKEVHEKYPVISAMGVIDAEGNLYDSVNDVIDDPLIQKYQYVQYANMFDEIAPAWFEVNGGQLR